jgi:amino acid adenylation domain-containing protein
MRPALHSEMVEQASRRPDGIAVRSTSERLTFGELTRQSAAVAQSLIERGVGPGAIVGVHLPRTPALLVALTGVLRSGAAYLPLDPDLPSTRLGFLVEDALPAVVLTSKNLLAELPAGCVSLPIEDLTAASTGGSLPDIDPDWLAYVIYTSGSTGRPKGVAVPHRCVTTMFAAMNEHVVARPGDVWLSVTSAGFDISVFELFWTIGRGLTVDLADTSGPALFATSLAARDRDITHLQATPTLLAALLLDPDSRAGIGRLKHLTVTGEAFPPETAHQVREAMAGTLLNAYGPTEATVWATVDRMPPEMGSPISIGRPLDGQWIAILDAAGGVVDEGDTGELYIGGSGVSWGYLGRPDLTAERFVPDPFSKRPGGRMYQTGDLGRRLSDGRIVCLGRNDRQVKVRGHRIELDEVEHALLALADVPSGAVIAQTGGRDPRIVAVVAGAGARADASALRRALAEVLPAAALPSGWQFVEELPRTTSGKVDRRALGDDLVSERPEPGPRVLCVNERGQYGMWWPERSIPPGWASTGVEGPLDVCRAEVASRWSDITPLLV